MNNKFKWFLLALLLSAGTAWADDPVEQKFTHRSTVELAATTTSGRVSIGAYAGTTAWVCNTDTSTGYVKFGDVTVVATTTGFPIEAGQCHTLSTSNASYMAGITASGTAALSAYIGTGSPSSSTASSSGGGGGGGDASAANQVTGNASLDSIDDKTPALISGAPPGYAYLTSPGQAAYGIVAKVGPAGGLYVEPPAAPIFDDPFDTTLDTTNRWTATGTTLPAVSGNAVVLSLGASNSVSSVLVSKPIISPTIQMFSLAAQLNLGAAQTNPNAHRWFGPCVVTVYAAATPCTNGHGFEVDTTGALSAVVYINDVRYVVNSTNPALITAPGSWATNMLLTTYGQTMTWPATGTATVLTRYFNGIVFFYLGDGFGGFDVPIGFASYVPANTQLPIRMASITTPAVSTVLATTFTGSSMVLSGALGNTTADPVFSWRRQGVDSAGRAYGVDPGQTPSSGTITTQNLVPAGVATAGSAVEIDLGGASTLTIQTTGTYTGALSVQVTRDGTNWITMGGTPVFNINTQTYLASVTSALQGVFQVGVSGFLKARVTALAAVTGTATVTTGTSSNTNAVNASNVTATSFNVALGAIGSTAPVTGGVNGTLAVGGNVAISAAATVNPLGVGGRVKTAHDTTLVAGDVAAANYTTDGAQIVMPYSAPDLTWQYAAAASGISNTTTAVTIKAAAAAGVRNYVKNCSIATDTLGAATEFAIRDGAAGTVIYRTKLQTTALPLTTINFDSPLRGSAATLLEIVTLTASVTGAVYASCQGFAAP